MDLSTAPLSLSRQLAFDFVLTKKIILLWHMCREARKRPVTGSRFDARQLFSEQGNPLGWFWQSRAQFTYKARGWTLLNSLWLDYFKSFHYQTWRFTKEPWTRLNRRIKLTKYEPKDNYRHNITPHPLRLALHWNEGSLQSTRYELQYPTPPTLCNSLTTLYPEG